MLIANVHENRPGEIRFTIVDEGRQMVRFIFLPANASALEVAAAIANNVNHYSQMKAQGFPYDYNEAEHIAGILKDAGRYGCD